MVNQYKLYLKTRDEIAEMISRDSSIVIEFRVNSFRRHFKVSYQEAYEIGEGIVDRYPNNVSMKDT
ncbi:hypothetical protein [Vagococcus salmoninarum]|uniref:hypothetical protein n=1 Tax=Vagococcus salmoninarum TaxID=2739 RepID=UPI00187E0E8F|nr:hypothetical protein [Vagococcus salmoninarum]MBE9390146.1 hypothetical protein [Vagococcus salmoninarum]